MIEYNYRAKSKDGEIITGAVEAENESAAAKVLMSKNLYPISLTTKQEQSLGFFKKVPAKQKAIFVRQLATTIAAGLPISQAVRTIREQVTNKNLQIVLDQVSRDIEGGSPLSASLSRFPESFSQTDTTLIAAGETSGTLESVLKRLADTIEKENKIAKKIRGALLYPAFVLAVVIGVIVLMAVYVMPQMEGLYKAFNANLPILTVILVAFSNFLGHFGWILAIVIAIIAIGLRWLIKTNTTARYNWDSMILKIPLIGKFLQKVYTARMTRTLSGLVGAGVSLVDSLQIVSRAVGNVIYADILKDAAEKVKSGIALSIPLLKSGAFDPMVGQMVRVGEETGEMDKMLSNLADYFDDEVDTFVASLSSVLEPALIVIMGIFVAVVLVAIMLPIYQFSSAIK